MLYIIIAILIFGVLIATHELGHFATAKLLGVKVNEFSVGMGPAVFKHQKGETLYSLRVLPIGGYCAMEGEDDDSSDPRSFGRAAGWKKADHPGRRGRHDFVTGLVILLVLYAPALGFYQEIYAGPLEGYGVEDSGLQPGDRFCRWTDTGCWSTETPSSISAGRGTPWTWWWSGTEKWWS